VLLPIRRCAPVSVAAAAFVFASPAGGAIGFVEPVRAARSAVAGNDGIWAGRMDRGGAAERVVRVASSGPG
jgi:hypothetical protein